MAHASMSHAGRPISADRTTEADTRSRNQYKDAAHILQRKTTVDNYASTSAVYDVCVLCRCWQLHCRITMRWRTLMLTVLPND